MTAAVKSAASMSTTATLRYGWRWKYDDQHHYHYQNQSQSCALHNSPLNNKMLLHIRRICDELCSRVLLFARPAAARLA
jgi:hypothetical protein